MSKGHLLKVVHHQVYNGYSDNARGTLQARQLASEEILARMKKASCCESAAMKSVPACLYHVTTGVPRS